jgi:hypothetical protein
MVGTTVYSTLRRIDRTQLVTHISNRVSTLIEFLFLTQKTY